MNNHQNRKRSNELFYLENLCVLSHSLLKKLMTKGTKSDTKKKSRKSIPTQTAHKLLYLVDLRLFLLLLGHLLLNDEILDLEPGEVLLVLEVVSPLLQQLFDY